MDVQRYVRNQYQFVIIVNLFVLCPCFCLLYVICVIASAMSASDSGTFKAPVIRLTKYQRRVQVSGKGVHIYQGVGSFC